jgi:tripartite-type tricarboxylate transporter receptor subunit TctC
MGNIETNQVKALAITSAQRAPSAPNIPTVAETLPGFNVQSIAGIVVPSATPRDIVNRINAAINQALTTPELRDRMQGIGMEPAPTTPEAFDQLIRSEITKWEAVVKASGMKVD